MGKKRVLLEIRVELHVSYTHTCTCKYVPWVVKRTEQSSSYGNFQKVKNHETRPAFTHTCHLLKHLLPRSFKNVTRTSSNVAKCSGHQMNLFCKLHFSYKFVWTFTSALIYNCILLHIYAHIHLHVHIHIIYVYIISYTYTYTYKYTNAYTSTYIYIYIYIYIHIHTYIYIVQWNVRLQIEHIYVYIYIYIYIYIYQPNHPSSLIPEEPVEAKTFVSEIKRYLFETNKWLFYIDLFVTPFSLYIYIYIYIYI